MSKDLKEGREQAPGELAFQTDRPGKGPEKGVYHTK